MPMLGNPERAPYAKPARNSPFDELLNSGLRGQDESLVGPMTLVTRE